MLQLALKSSKTQPSLNNSRRLKIQNIYTGLRSFLRNNYAIVKFTLQSEFKENPPPLQPSKKSNACIKAQSNYKEARLTNNIAIETYYKHQDTLIDSITIRKEAPAQ